MHLSDFDKTMDNKTLNRLIRKLSRFHHAVERLVYDQWYCNPICSEPLATRDLYLSIAETVKGLSYPEIDLFEQQCGYSVNKEWLDDLALHTQVIKKESPICYAHGRVLYSALSCYLEGYAASLPSERVTILETGTSRGFSALCMAKALHDKGRPGTIITFDILPHDAPMYWNCIDDCDFVKRTRGQLLSPWRDLVRNHLIFIQGDTRLELPKARVSRVNFAFLDGAHTFDDVMFEFNQIKDLQEAGDMVIYDDYTRSQFPGLVEAVDVICTRFGYSRTEISAYAGRGYVVATKK